MDLSLLLALMVFAGLLYCLMLWPALTLLILAALVLLVIVAANQPRPKS